jgi:hemerythrin
MPIVEVDAIPRVAMPFQNEDHVAEARLLNRAADALSAHRDGRASAADVLAPVEALLAHTREHFAREDAVMLETGFPPYPVHQGEHARVLAGMQAEVEAFRAGGDAGRLWTYLTQAVPEWFVQHIETMDAVTAQFVAARLGPR